MSELNAIAAVFQNRQTRGPSGVLVSEKVFGILLAALAVQPMLGGVADLIALAGHSF